MPIIKRISHVGLTVPDVEATADFYENIVGLEISARVDGAAFLRCNGDHHCLALYPGETRGLHHLGLEVHDQEALQVAHEELLHSGVTPETHEYVEPGHGEARFYRDPDGHLIELSSGMESVNTTLQPREIRPLKYGHITIMTTDLARALEFYVGVLGFRISDTVDGAVAWLRCNQEHHGVAFLSSNLNKVNHYAYDLTGWEDMKRLCDHLWRNNVPIIYGPSRHGPGNNLFIYIPDPAGNIVEMTTELAQVWDEESYQPLNWDNSPGTVDVWRGLSQPDYMLAGDGRDPNDWSAGSAVVGQGWYVPEFEEFVAMDPDAKVVAPTAKNPELRIEIPSFTVGFDNPLDHVKAMVSSQRRYPTGRGLSVAADIAVEVNGTDANPFGAESDDPRLASGSIGVIDDSTGVVINFEISNRRVLALRELFLVMTPAGDSGAIRPMAESTLLDLEIDPGSWHRYEIRYSPGEDNWLSPGPDNVQWLVDNHIVHEVDWVATVEPPASPVIKPARFRVNLSIFTLLDDLPDGRGGTLVGLDSDYENTVFGQGVTARWRNVEVLEFGQQRHLE